MEVLCITVSFRCKKTENQLTVLFNIRNKGNEVLSLDMPRYCPLFAFEISGLLSPTNSNLPWPVNSATCCALLFLSTVVYRDQNAHTIRKNTAISSTEPK